MHSFPTAKEKLTCTNLLSAYMAKFLHSSDRDQTDWNTQTANLHEGLFSQGFGVMGRL